MYLSIRSVFLPLVMIFTVIALTSCSEHDDNPGSPTPSEQVWVVLDDDSVQTPLSSLPKFMVDGEEAIRLNEFVTDVLVPDFVDRDNVHYDARPLYGYQIIGDDGFSASGNRGYADNTWAHLNMGYLLVDNRRAIFPDDSIDLPGAYNVQGVRYIVLHRKFDLQRPADAAPDSHAFVELRVITPVTVTNPDGQPESALPLADFVTRIISDPASFQYNVVALDGFGPTSTMPWEKFQTGYWLLTTQKTMFTDTSLVGGRYKLSVLESIVLSR